MAAENKILIHDHGNINYSVIAMAKCMHNQNYI